MAWHLKNDVPDFGWMDMLKAFLFFFDRWKKKYFFFLLIILLTFFYSTVVPVFIIGKIVDFFASFKNEQSLNYFYILVVLLGTSLSFVAIIRLTAKNILYKIQSEVSYFTRVRGFERLLDFSIKWHDKENTGNKVQKIQNGTDSLSQLQRFLQNDIIVIIAYVGGILIFFAIFKIVYFLFCLLYLIMFLIVQASFYKKQLTLQNEYNSRLEKASGTYYEGLSNVLTIKTLGVKEDFRKNIINKEELSRDLFKKITQLGTDKWKLFQIINALFISLFLILIGHDFLAKNLTLGSIFVYTNYFMNITQNVGQSTNLFDQLINFKISIGRMMPIYWEKSIVKEGHLNFPENWNEINISESYFDYKNTIDDDPKNSALNNINLIINRYEKIGIVGKSGSGKSTLAKIFLGLYEFNKGSFQIGQTKFYDIKHDEITNNISLVLQDSEMFNLSLKDNITLMRKFNETLFEQAVEIAQLKDIIKKLPEGLETFIGEKGYRLSGGERQRIGIARAMYKDSQILVLDEATSSLDTKTESLIQKAIETKLDKKTIIIIAHRISTLKNVDKIYVFENGEIAEEGTFDKLSLDKNSKFYDLSKLQQSQNII